MKKIKDMQRGVYTVTCGRCGQSTYVHVDNEGVIDPTRCQSCKVEFLNIEKGDRNNQYVAEVPEEETTEESYEIKEDFIKNKKTKSSNNKKNKGRKKRR